MLLNVFIVICYRFITNCKQCIDSYFTERDKQLDQVCMFIIQRCLFAVNYNYCFSYFTNVIFIILGLKVPFRLYKLNMKHVMYISNIYL